MLRLRQDPRIKQVEWRDLLELSRVQKAWELTLSVPWLIASLLLYQGGWWLVGLGASFFFFLTGLRQSHGAQHYSLGVGRRAQDLALFGLSVLMLASMHALQATHMHHHRHCLDESDAESSTAGMAWWKAILAGPWFIVHLHRSGYRLAKPAKRPWIWAELAAMCGWITLAGWLAGVQALQWHLGAMLAGEMLSGFFAVWTVHHHCDAHSQIARTQRGWWKNLISYEMFFHLEHHLFPAVPTPRLPELARRLDAAAPPLHQKQVF